LFGRYSYALRRSFGSGTSSAIGIGFTDTMNNEFGHYVGEWMKVFGPPITFDVSGWDRSLSLEALRMGAYCAWLKMADRDDHLWWLGAMDVWAVTAACSFYHLPDGTLWRKEYEGMMPSGSYGTSTFNTTIRAFVSALCGTRCIANGDDTVEFLPEGSTMEEVVARYESMGFRLRDVQEESMDAFSFCSHGYRLENGLWKATLESWPKMVYAYFVRGAKDDARRAILLEVRNNSELPRIGAAVMAPTLSPIPEDNAPQEQEPPAQESAKSGNASRGLRLH
jgi:hypothetical protein